MFDSIVATTAGTRGAAAVGAWARVENAACARRIAVMVTMLDDAYAASDSADRDLWYLDNWSAVSAHVGAAQCITAGAAGSQLTIGTALRDRLPLVAAVFAEGLIGYALVRTIVIRTHLVSDPAALRQLDELLAAALREWEPVSKDRTDQAIDAYVEKVDPGAVRRTQTRAKSRSLDVHTEDGSGIAEVFGTLFAHDAIALNGRVAALAATTCREDPRTLDQRRADAVGALARGQDRLACLCGAEGCPAAVNPPSTGVVVYVIASQDTLDTPEFGDPSPDAAPTPEPAPDSSAGESNAVCAERFCAQCAGLDGAPAPLFDRPVRDLTVAELFAPRPGESSVVRPGATMGGRFLPGAVTRRAALNATLVRIVHPGQAPPERHYRPSKKLADFVRCRDLTCRFPGCTVPATNCDVDHTIPWPCGPTQASNLKCLCRRHHLLKTHWGGAKGWRDRQRPDGTVEWTAPSGETYTTTPGSRLLFPELCTPTAPAIPTGRPVAHTLGLTMPRRRTTRAQDRARRIIDERELNRLARETEDADREAQRAAWDAAEEARRAKEAAEAPPPPF